MAKSAYERVCSEKSKLSKEWDFERVRFHIGIKSETNLEVEKTDVESAD